MSGNVWEWTRSDYKSKKDFNDFGFDPEIQALFDKGDYILAYEKSEEKIRNFPVLRGGSWDDSRDLAQCALRCWFFPEFRSDVVGFRCARTKK